MKRILNPITITTGLAIFSMLFGASNLMFPLAVGLHSGDKNLWAIIGFLITSVCLPVIGLVSIILFNGNVEAFFGRLGKIPGFIMYSICVLIIGPVIAMPRIVTFSYTMVAPFLPAFDYSRLPLISSLSNPELFIFSIAFLGLTLLATIRESRILDLLGYIISPILLISLGIIIIKGLITGSPAQTFDVSGVSLFWENLKFGYHTLDVLGGIFFSSIVIHILKQKLPGESLKNLATTGLTAGAIGAFLLGIIYFGLSYLGVYHGAGLENVHPGVLFSNISFRIIGQEGALIIATAVLMACFSTIIALAAVFTEYLELELFRKKISYPICLIITLALTLIPSSFDLAYILEFSEPLIAIIYPAIIILTICNLLYKLCNFKLVTIPVLITLLASVLNYFSL
ncbi:MAG: branched-chain amino acid transport system II carrier protein [Candidatus Babeliales bacterium]